MSAPDATPRRTLTRPETIAMAKATLIEAERKRDEAAQAEAARTADPDATPARGDVEDVAYRLEAWTLNKCGDGYPYLVGTHLRRDIIALLAERDALAQRVAALEADARRLRARTHEIQERADKTIAAIKKETRYARFLYQSGVDALKEYREKDGVARHCDQDHMLVGLLLAEVAALRATPTPEAK